MFDDYVYTPGAETEPQPGTTPDGFNWENFINGVVRGTTEIIAVTRQPPNTLPYRPTYTTSGVSTADNMLILAVVIIGAVLLLK